MELRADEKFAAACIAAALGDVEVRQHDDGSSSGMFDLEILRGVGAVEVTMAMDEDCQELWRLVNSEGRWIRRELAGGWIIELRPSARARRLFSELPGLLREAELEGPTPVGPRLPERVTHALPGLGVIYASQSATQFPGSVYFTIRQPPEMMSGYAGDTGDELAQWIGEFLHNPSQAHNLEKLRRSTAAERHMFVVFPGFSVAPFSVTDLLLRRDAPLPTIAPS
ncbi:MAG TPA: hypothetical protein VFW14_20810, partial [Gaiellales bacterium]|nr:hypothetical protein [Gaiellales bacterium]